MDTTVKTLKFHKAGVYWNDGALIINAKASTRINLHRDVEVTITETGNVSKVHVVGKSHRIGLALSEGEFNLDDITEDSIVEYKPWPWSKTKKRRSSNLVTFKEYDTVEFTATSFEIIK